MNIFGTVSMVYDLFRPHKNVQASRMMDAMVLAEKCWGKAHKSSPLFVEEYLSLAHDMLQDKKFVTGDMFRKNCRDKLLLLPRDLHPNTWVSGVRALNLMGWISPIERVVPVESHNHMGSVMMWKSNLYKEQ